MATSRKMKMGVWAAAAMVAGMAAGLPAIYGADAIQAAPVAGVTITEADAGKTLEAAVGQTVTIALHSNAASGYSWRITSLEGNALEQAGSVEYVPSRGRFGEGGMSLVTLRAVQPGESRITIGDGRSWETGAASGRSFAVTVDVTGVATVAASR